MRTTTLFAAGVLIASFLVAIPGDAVTRTASANICTHHLADGDVKTYVRCTEQQCQWQNFPYGPIVCTD